MSAMLSKLMAESLHWSHFKHALLFQPQPHTTTANHTYIAESVDCICRDSVDTQYNYDNTKKSQKW